MNHFFILRNYDSIFLLTFYVCKQNVNGGLVSRDFLFKQYMIALGIGFVCVALALNAYESGTMTGFQSVAALLIPVNFFLYPFSVFVYERIFSEKFREGVVTTICSIILKGEGETILRFLFGLVIKVALYNCAFIIGTIGFFVNRKQKTGLEDNEENLQ